MIAKQVMNKDVIYLSPENTVKEALTLMLKNNISGLPVVDGQGQVIGMITEKDILRRGKRSFSSEHNDLMEMFLYAQSPQRYEREIKAALKMKVASIMTTDVITAKDSTPVGEIAMIMIENDVNRIPIVSKGKLVGIIGREDMIKTFADISQGEED